MSEPRAHVGLGRPREASNAPGGPAIVHPVAATIARMTSADGDAVLAGATGDQQQADVHKADRARRLLMLTQGNAPPDIWTDVLEILTELFDDTLNEVMDGTKPPACLAVLRDFGTRIDEKVVLGAGAMQRLTRQHLLAMQAQAHAAKAATANTGD